VAAMMRDLYLAVLVGINAYFLATALSNIVFFRLATKAPRVTSGPFVSVIVPTRNEERSIARCLESLLRQGYADYEVVVVDDESGDATAGIVAALAAHEPRLRLVSGVPLPDTWLGKPHALSQGAAVARGEILILTDADTVHSRESISWAVTNLQDHQADILSGYLRQEYGSLGESIVVPTMYAMMLLVPLFLLPRTKSPGLAFAIGQFVAVRREALTAVGGFEAIKDSIVDDMSMATRMKESGYRNVFLDAKRVAACRLYSGYRDAFRGIERSIYSAVGGRPLTVLAISAIVLGLIVGPALWALVSIARIEIPGALVAVSVVLFAVQWALVVWDRNVPFSAFVLYPLVFLNLIVILAASMLDTGFGPGVDWKGRMVRLPRSSSAASEARRADLASRRAK
jgi:chlorobactene glucosyltransferase